VVIVDDVADLGRSFRELGAVLALLGDTSAGDTVIDASLRDVVDWMWSMLGERCSTLPAYDALAEMLAFDWRMVFTGALRACEHDRDLAA
jgi:hypothetical protein